MNVSQHSAAGSTKRGRPGQARGAAGRLRRNVDERGIALALLDRTPIAVVDVETTGLRSDDDRVVEVCVVRLEPIINEQDEWTGWRRETVLSTLINPGRPMGATHVHGITEAHVEHAPNFGGISRELLASFDGAVLAGWNAHFDVRFLCAEFKLVGLEVEFPFVCSMRLRAMAGLGPAVSLKRACAAHHIDLEGHHSAQADTVATAKLTELCLHKLRERGLERFKDLRKLHGYAFIKSFKNQTIRGDESLFLPEPQPLLVRSSEHMPANATTLREPI